MRRTPMPSRVTPLRRTGPTADVIILRGGGKVSPFPKQPKNTTAVNTWRLVNAILEDKRDRAPRRALKAVSGKRARENRQRAVMADRRWPDRREGTVMCTVPGCGPADDLHEVLTRARGGSITDPENTVPLCRQHNHDLAQKPESELGWAYDCGLLRHSWGDDDGPGAA